MRYFILILVLISSVSTYAQIELINPSFEGIKPQDATMPIGWLGCKSGTTPDILPGPWGVIKEPSEGETYLGLITRKDNSWESITQRLSKEITGGKCYSIKMDLAYSIRYPMHNSPVTLRVYGTMDKCKEAELLFTSELIDNTDWETFEFLFKPNKNFRYILFEAYYPGDEKIGGNVLIDNIQLIKECGRA
jgi:hypothetical protein